MDYELEMKRFSDHENALAYAKKKGIAIGEAKGIGKGILQTAKNMLAKGYSVADIIDITKLPKKQIMALR